MIPLAIARVLGGDRVRHSDGLRPNAAGVVTRGRCEARTMRASIVTFATFSTLATLAARTARRQTVDPISDALELVGGERALHSVALWFGHLRAAIGRRSALELQVQKARFRIARNDQRRCCTVQIGCFICGLVDGVSQPRFGMERMQVRVKVATSTLITRLKERRKLGRIAIRDVRRHHTRSAHDAPSRATAVAHPASAAGTSGYRSPASTSACFAPGVPGAPGAPGAPGSASQRATRTSRIGLAACSGAAPGAPRLFIVRTGDCRRKRGADKS